MSIMPDTAILAARAHKLTKEREIASYVSVHPDDDR